MKLLTMTATGGRLSSRDGRWGWRGLKQVACDGDFLFSVHSPFGAFE